MTIPYRKGTKQFLIEMHGLRGVDRIHAIKFVDWLPQHHAPPFIALFESINETADAGDVNFHAIDLATLDDLHPRLGDGTRPVHINADRAQRVKADDAGIETLLAACNKFGSTGLEPGGVHPPVRVPDCCEALPVSRIAPDHPVLQKFVDRHSVQHRIGRNRMDALPLLHSALLHKVSSSRSESAERRLHLLLAPDVTAAPRCNKMPFA